MILEYAQILSTTHRVLDGIENILPDDRDSVLYRATHINHPSTVWARQSSAHYIWLLHLFKCLSQEYYLRYGKIHKTYSKLDKYLSVLPNNIHNKDFTAPTPAMPKDVPGGSSLEKYRNYYKLHKGHIASWKNRDVPHWYSI
jgi:hypothetical protein